MKAKSRRQDGTLWRVLDFHYFPLSVHQLLQSVDLRSRLIAAFALRLPTCGVIVSLVRGGLGRAVHMDSVEEAASHRPAVPKAERRRRAHISELVLFLLRATLHRHIDLFRFIHGLLVLCLIEAERHLPWLRLVVQHDLELDVFGRGDPRGAHRAVVLELVLVGVLGRQLQVLLLHVALEGRPDGLPGLLMLHLAVQHSVLALTGLHRAWLYPRCERFSFEASRRLIVLRRDELIAVDLSHRDHADWPGVELYKLLALLGEELEAATTGRVLHRNRL